MINKISFCIMILIVHRITGCMVEDKKGKEVKVIQTKEIPENWLSKTYPVEVFYDPAFGSPACNYILKVSKKNPKLKSILDNHKNCNIVIVSPESKRHIDYSLVATEKDKGPDSSLTSCITFFYFLYNLLFTPLKK